MIAVTMIVVIIIAGTFTGPVDLLGSLHRVYNQNAHQGW
jgi:hypothetical protein